MKLNELALERFVGAIVVVRAQMQQPGTRSQLIDEATEDTPIVLDLMKALAWRSTVDGAIGQYDGPLQGALLQDLMFMLALRALERGGFARIDSNRTNALNN